MTDLYNELKDEIYHEQSLSLTRLSDELRKKEPNAYFTSLEKAYNNLRKQQGAVVRCRRS